MANWLLRGRLWLPGKGRKKDGQEPDAALREARAVFSADSASVFSACETLAPLMTDPPRKTAAKYLTCVLDTEQDVSWWQDNAPYLNQPWFIWQYVKSHNLATPKPDAAESPAYFVLQPPDPRPAPWATMHIIRDLAHPEHGLLEISGPEEEDDFVACVHACGLKPQNGAYARRIGETSAPLMDRAVESGVALLEAGFSLCVEEPLLRARILQREFAPEHRHWVTATPRPDRLRLLYPRDQRLHRYVCLAGAVWNGRFMEISIRFCDRVRELMAIYDFRATTAAGMRMEAWEQAVNEATVYRQRKLPKEPLAKTEDLFKQILNRKIQLIDDLKDCDE